MVFQEGQSGNLNGRPKGSRTIAVNIIYKVFNEFGKEKFEEEMKKQALENPIKFYKEFIAPIQPKEMTISGDEDSPLMVTIKYPDDK